MSIMIVAILILTNFCNLVWAKEDKIIGIVDGDTIKTQKLNLVRLIGINTPEIHVKRDKKWTYQPAPYALEAKTFLQNKLSDKDFNIVLGQQKKDKYDRWLGYVYNEGEMLNLSLLKNGLATVLLIYPNVRFAERFVLAQSQAIKNKIGIWSGIKDGLVDVRNIADYEGYGCKVKGEIKRSVIKKNCLEWKVKKNNRFLVKIYKTRWFVFEKKGFDLKRNFTNKQFILVGYVSKKGDYWEMILDDSEQIIEK